MLRGTFKGRTRKVTALEVPPPGEGFLTVTLTEPGEAILPAEIEAVSRVPFTKIVGRLELLQITTESEVKFEPLSVRVKPPPPALAELGLIELRAGCGFVIRNVKDLVAVAEVGCVWSLTLKVKLKSPAAEGVPLKIPVPALNETPWGSEPDATDHW